MSAAIGASAAGARVYTATASQGLLYMVEALYNASGLGLPIVMTVANRAIGAPINIWNDHSDTMSQRDSGWIQLYARSNQEAVDLHLQAFKLAEELSLPVMVCMDGFVLTHAFERGRPPDAGAGRRVPAAVRAAPAARPRRPGDDRRDGRPGGVHRGQVPDAREADAGARPRSPRSPREFSQAFGRSSGGLVRALPQHGRRDDRRRARLGPRDDRGRRRRAARRRASGSAPSASSASAPSRSRRSAHALARRATDRRRSRRRSRSASAGSSGQNVRLALAGVARAGLRRGRRASAGGRSPSARSTRSSPTCSRTGSSPAASPSSISTGDSSSASSRARETHRRSGPHAENILRDLGAVAAGSH